MLVEKVIVAADFGAKYVFDRFIVDSILRYAGSAFCISDDSFKLSR